MKTYNKDSQIVKVFAEKLKGNETEKFKDADKYTRDLAELAKNGQSMEAVKELAEILRFTINEGLVERTRYYEKFADVKRTGFGEKAQFDTMINGLKAFFQAKDSTTERSTISSKSVQLTTGEVSVRPIIQFYDLASGKVNIAQIAEQALVQLDNAVAKRVQQVTYDAFKTLGAKNYAAGSGLVAAAFNQILNNVKRQGGGQATIWGDFEALGKFHSMAGYTADALQLEQNENGYIGRYLGANVLQMNENSFEANSTNTILRKDLIYVLAGGSEANRNVKIHFEGGLQNISLLTPNIDDKHIELRFDQYVGVGIVGDRKSLGIYEDTTLA